MAELSGRENNFVEHTFDKITWLQCTGSLHASWSSLTGLQELFLDNNRLTGAIRCFGLTALSAIDHSIKDGWSVGRLKGLWLCCAGSLPASWSELSSLKVLQLNNNTLIGALIGLSQVLH